MNTPTRILPVLSTLALLAGACTDETTDPGAQVFRDTLSGGCTNCNNNSPRVNDFGVPDLNLDGLENGDHIRLMGIIDEFDDVYDVEFDGDDIRAVTATGDLVAAGPALEQWRLWLRNEDDEDLYIHIFDHATMVSPYTNYSMLVSVYAMAYEDPNVANRFWNVCPESHNNPYATTVTLIAKEKYNPKTNEPEPAPRSITIACAAQAAYKMKLLGYTPTHPFGGILGGTPSSLAQRRATLKMITADYCGDGGSHTKQGMEVNWYNQWGTAGTATATNVFEAVWHEEGAVCLSVQRYPDPENPVTCDPPTCESATFTGEWTTRVAPAP